MAMESKAKMLGHGVHPILVMFPLGLFLSGLIFDLLAAALKKPHLAAVGYWNITGGLAGGVAAAVPGFIDWQAIPEGTRAKQIGRLHGLGNLGLMGLFGASWLLRRNAPSQLPGAGPLALEVLGAAAAGATGWLGGELVERLGVGVAPGAHLNAPSSLSRAAGSELGGR
ncbi:MAG TPA: DUF2231 domain-containing protein [Herpetosiphonaceae bacterium]